MSFLTAEWRKLIMANYIVDKEILMPYLPAGTELDVWNDAHYISLIGFLFKDVKLLGIPIPFHRTFEEVNLRFYVRHLDAGIWRRGVVFIKEIVPKFALSLIANTLYNEKYQTLPMSYNWDISKDYMNIDYKWKVKGHWQGLSVAAGTERFPILPSSETEFITEHYWGYAGYSSAITNEYEVKHPRWEQYEVKSYKINVDFELTYGERFRFLNLEKPSSVFLAEGSEISIEKKNIIRDNT
jgi:uncharacterized protein YqjF (DUF2071 family)